MRTFEPIDLDLAILSKELDELEVRCWADVICVGEIK
jgi:hypothetical protein